jgi:hypothetical protein
MPRFHFHLTDHKTIEDKGGQILVDEVAAIDVANELARQLYRSEPELLAKGFFILVTNDDGDEIHRVATRPSVNA